MMATTSKELQPDVNVLKALISNHSLLVHQKTVLLLEEIARRKRLYGVVIPILLFLAISAAVINLYILASLRWLRTMLTPILILTLSLATADFCTSVIISAGLIINSYLPIVNGELLPHHSCISFALEALRLGSILTSILHLLALSVTHYLATAKPVFYRKHLSTQSISIVIALMYVLPITGFLVTFSSVDAQGFRSAGCKSSASFETAVFRSIIFILLFTPLLIMACVYIAIGLILHKLSQQLMRQRSRRGKQTTQSTPSTQSTASEPVGTQLRASHIRRKIKTFKTALFICGSFLLGWLPGALLYILTCGECVLSYQNISPHLMVTFSLMANILIILKGILNPVIYAFRIPEMQQAVVQNSRLCFECCGMRNQVLKKVSQQKRNSNCVSTNTVTRTTITTATTTQLLPADADDDSSNRGGSTAVLCSNPPPPIEKMPSIENGDISDQRESNQLIDKQQESKRPFRLNLIRNHNLTFKKRQHLPKRSICVTL